jgi:putative nucleotidyltransferase with HDIG domain
MAAHIPTREEALALLREYNPTESLVKHGLAVEAVMRRFAGKLGGDPEVWGVVGLIHDLDYERFPAEHCSKTGEILRERGWPEEYIRAAVSHGWGICSDVEPMSSMEKTLYAVDELTGLVATTALVRPSRSVMDVTVSSVKKKWKDKRFAAGVDRSVVERGAERLGVGLEELIGDAIEGMKAAAAELGLQGTPSSPATPPSGQDGSRGGQG